MSDKLELKNFLSVFIIHFFFLSNGTNGAASRGRWVNINPLEGSHSLEPPFNPLQTHVLALSLSLSLSRMSRENEDVTTR